MKKTAKKEAVVAETKKVKAMGPKKIDDTFYKLRDFAESYLCMDMFRIFDEVDKLVGEMKDVHYDFSLTVNDVESQTKMIESMLKVRDFVYSFMNDGGETLFTPKVYKEWSKLLEKTDALREQAEKNGLV